MRLLQYNRDAVESKIQSLINIQYSIYQDVLHNFGLCHGFRAV